MSGDSGRPHETPQQAEERILKYARNEAKKTELNADIAKLAREERAKVLESLDTSDPPKETGLLKWLFGKKS